MPTAYLDTKGKVNVIKPTDKVLSEAVSPCPKCGDDHPENRAVRLWGFQGSELYCTLCGQSLGKIGG